MRNSRKGRFRVWDEARDSFNGEDLVFNFDAIDELIGGKSGTSGSSGSQYLGVPDSWLGYGDVIPGDSNATYPGTSNGGYENQTGRRTLYSVVSGLNFNDVPLGTVIMWWRPNSQFPIPDGWVPCDGSTVLAADHSFPTSENIILPDMRNKFVLGADHGVAGIKATTNYGLETGAAAAQNKNNLWNGTKAQTGTTGAPGIGYDSGLEASVFSGDNVQRDASHEHGQGTLTIRDHSHVFSHKHNIQSHSHKLAAHTHRHEHVHLVPNHYHDFNTTNSFFTGQARVSASDGSEGKITFPKGMQTDVNPASKDHVHRIDMNSAGATGERKLSSGAANLGFFTGYWSTIWGYNTDPRNVASGAGYQPQAVSSKPTTFYQSGGSLDAHQPRFDTDESALRATDGSGDLSTDVPVSGSDRTAGVLDTGSPFTNPRGVEGTTARINIKFGVRPQYVGMLFLMKVRVSTNII